MPDAYAHHRLPLTLWIYLFITHTAYHTTLPSLPDIPCSTYFFFLCVRRAGHKPDYTPLPSRLLQRTAIPYVVRLLVFLPAGLILHSATDHLGLDAEPSTNSLLRGSTRGLDDANTTSGRCRTG